MKQPKTSLEKSHSPWSNTKLTLLCFLSTLGVSALWVSIALRNVMNNFTVWMILVCASGALTVLTMLLFSKFKR